jgi:hypothetical protein
LRAGCIPKLMRHLLLGFILYRAQKRKLHGLPSKSNRNSGSKLNLSEPKEKLKILAGLPKEKVGMNEMPLFVTLIEPEK